MAQTRILLVDDHAVVRVGIQLMISTEPTFQVVGEAKNGQDAVKQIGLLKPDVILMDLVMPEGDGIEAIAEIKRVYQDIRIIALTSFEDATRISRAIEAGADGYLLKDADGVTLLKAIKSVQQGEMPLHPRIARYLVKTPKNLDNPPPIEALTKREIEILQLISQGMSNKAVAEILGLKPGTIKVYVSKILDKLHLNSRTEAAVWATQVGLHPLHR